MATAMLLRLTILHQYLSVSAGKILVSVKASGVNPADWKISKGISSRWHLFNSHQRIGIDFSGICQTDQKNMMPSDFKQGDEVYGQTSS